MHQIYFLMIMCVYILPRMSFRSQNISRLHYIYSLKIRLFTNQFDVSKSLREETIVFIMRSKTGMQTL
ncbi:hypothetical protein NUSPORA_00819 [Nucleospora cyclopteri]